jgi:hypothetical protein
MVSDKRNRTWGMPSIGRTRRNTGDRTFYNTISIANSKQQPLYDGGDPDIKKILTPSGPIRSAPLSVCP